MVTRMLRVALALVGVMDSGRCRCGHPRDVHEHYRSGTDCSACSWTWPTADPRFCTRYRPTWRRA